MRSQHGHRWRLLTWVIIAFNLAMLLWLVVALDAAGEEDGPCVAGLCPGANDPGSTTGAWLVIFFWLAGAVLLGVAWMVTHRTERPRRRHRRGWHRKS
jgi:H+/Cl- antiporter ClcA